MAAQWSGEKEGKEHAFAECLLRARSSSKRFTDTSFTCYQQIYEVDNNIHILYMRKPRLRKINLSKNK